MAALQRQTHVPDSDSWLKHPVVCYLARVGELTRKNRQYRLDKLAAWLSKGRHNALSYAWADLQYEHLVAIRASLAERYAPGSVNQYLITIRGLLKEYWRLGYIEGEHYRRILDVPGVTDDGPRAGRDVQMDELGVLLGWMEQEASLVAVRDSAILVVLYGTGMRRAELCQLVLANYDAHACSFLIRHGKGGHSRVTYAPEWVKPQLATWLDVRGDAPGALFTSLEYGRVDPAYEHLSPETVSRMVARRAKQAGLKHMTPHDYRRSNICRLFDAGVDVSVIAQNVGHKHINTTGSYDRRGDRARQGKVNLMPSPF